MMKLYRAAKDEYLNTGCCFAATRAHAEAYLDNPGFGGSIIFCAEIDESSARIARYTTLRELADLLVDLVDADDLVDFFGSNDVYDIADKLDVTGTLYPWAHSPRLERFLSVRFDWMVYPDDFPAGCETWCCLSDAAVSAAEDAMTQI